MRRHQAGALIPQDVLCKWATRFPTATAVAKVLEERDIVTELTGQKKNRSYSYAAYIALRNK